MGGEEGVADRDEQGRLDAEASSSSTTPDSAAIDCLILPISARMKSKTRCVSASNSSCSRLLFSIRSTASLRRANSVSLGLRAHDCSVGAVCDIRSTHLQAFRAFDRRCAGFLTLSDVKGVFREVAPHVAERTIEAIFFEFDDDRDGRVNFAQFERLWQNGA